MRNISLPRRIGKKGLSMQMIAVLILMLLLLIGMLMFQQKFFQELPGYKSWARCKASVEANSLLRLKQFEFSPGVDCHTDSISIKSKRKANPEIAKAMTNCWNTFGRGNLNLFSDDGRFCFVCSVIDFEKAPASFTKLDGFYDFMFNSRVPRSAETYMDFLTNGNGNQLKEQIESQGKNLKDIEMPVQKYAVYFIYDKGKDFVEKEIKTSVLPEINVNFQPDSSEKVKGSIMPGTSSIPLKIGIFIGGGLIGLGLYHGLATISEKDQWRASIILEEYNSAELQAMECTENLPKS